VPIGAHHIPGRLTSGSDDIESLTKTLHLSSLYINLFNGSDPKVNYAEIENCIRAYELNSVINNSATVKEITEGIKNLFPIFEIKIDEKKYIDIIEAARYESEKLSSDLLNQVQSQSECLDQLKQQVGLDSMTQLYNHDRFMEILHQEISRATRYKTPLSIIIADVDHFKSVNDFFGHQAGDHALKCVSSHLKKLLRDSDHIARYGGEEHYSAHDTTQGGNTSRRKIEKSYRIRKNCLPREIYFGYHEFWHCIIRKQPANRCRGPYQDGR
jgi:diguanylate cyclase (GGDEF)-like protein